MKHIEFANKVVAPTFSKCTDILVDRGASYASDEDFLENFKHSAIILTEIGFSHHGKPLTPESFALWNAVVKTQRWSNRMREGKDRTDDHIDGINYHLLGYACELDEDKEVT